MPPPAKKEGGTLGFTLIEVMVTVGVIGLFVGAAYLGLLKLNSYATSNRLYTCASQMVQEVIDQALSVRPFYPATSGTSADPFDQKRNSNGVGGLPTGLMLSDTLGTAKVTKIPVYLDAGVLSTGTTASLKTTSDVLSSATVVQGTLTVLTNEASITTGGATASPSLSGTSYLRRVSVSLSYQFCGQTFNIQRTCLRAPDQ
ncbi:MAG: type II secretion system protein [Chthoniobacteraceae bacterium]